MADLFRGQTMTEAYKFISAGTAHTFTFNFQPDKVTFYNLSRYVAATTNLPVISTWFRDQTAAGDAYQMHQIQTDEAAENVFLTETTNGFTVADTSGGVTSSHKLIDAISQADPCVVSTSTAHGFQTDQIVRITDLGSDMPTARGMDQLNNNRYKIVVIDSDDFSLKDVITGEPIDSTAFTAYVSGGRVTLETHVISLNNPQVSPYSNSNPYDPNPYSYDPVEYKLTAGTAVMGSDGNVFFIEVLKYGQVTDLGDLLV